MLPGLAVCAGEASSASCPCKNQAPQQTLLSAVSFSLSIQPGTRKPVKSREDREQKGTPFSPAQHTEARARLHPQRHHCTLTLHGWYCTPGGCSYAKGHCVFRQLGQEAASFPSKQRLVGQRQFSETCFECRERYPTGTWSCYQEWGVSG